MTSLERAAREAWIRWGSYAKWTTCSGCSGWRYCRARGGERYLCLGCHDQG